MIKIGTIYTPFTVLTDMPIQPQGAKDVIGRIEVLPGFAAGLKDLDGFSHIYLIYLFHKANREELEVIPFMDTEKHGVYATRSPLRPNHIGLSLVELQSVEGNAIQVKGIDILDNTPLIDIKPFIPAFDHADNVKTGWMNSSKEEIDRRRSDSRFT